VLPARGPGLDRVRDVMGDQHRRANPPELEGLLQGVGVPGPGKHTVHDFLAPGAPAVAGVRGEDGCSELAGPEVVDRLDQLRFHGHERLPGLQGRLRPWS